MKAERNCLSCGVELVDSGANGLCSSCRSGAQPASTVTSEGDAGSGGKPVPEQPSGAPDAFATLPATASEAQSPIPSAQTSRLPGTILLARYRLIALLGRGGMGEVYRADDLKLGQPVALKFLSEELKQTPERLLAFLNEVKLARQVRHPNVCAVFDADEVDGHHFLTMEYVDGEDLETLCRRIGRPPPEKALEIAVSCAPGSRPYMPGASFTGISNPPT